MIIEALEYTENSSEKFLESYAKQVKPVYLYGAGAGHRYYKKWLEKNGINAEGTIDGGKSKQKGLLSIKDFGNNNIDAYFIISAPGHRHEIKEIISKYTEEDNIFAFDPVMDIIQNNDFKLRKEYYKNNVHELEKLYSLLSDDKSRVSLIKVLEGSISNDCDCYSSIAGESQYFPGFITENMTDTEIFVDVGAYTGDTILEFFDVTKKHYKKIYAFEPDESNYNSLKQYEMEDVIIYPYGVSDKRKTVWFENDSGGGTNEAAKIVESKTDFSCKIECVSLDEIIEDKISFIKMDIEGEELQALQGAEKLIKEFKPKLAISVYHRVEDLVEIPRQILNMNASYKLYLRHFWDSNGSDTVLFAI